MAFSTVASATAGSTDGGASATTAGIDTTGANLLVAAVSWYAPGGALTLSDSYGNTWTGLTTVTPGNWPAVRLYYCYAPAVGAGHTLTASGSGTFPTVSVAAYSGAASSPFDAEAAGATGTGATSAQPGSLTPSADGALVVTAVATDPGTGHAVSGYTAAQSDYSSGQHEGGGVAWLVQGAAAAANPTWTWTGSSRYAVAGAAFLAAGGAAAGHTLPRRRRWRANTLLRM